MFTKCCALNCVETKTQLRIVKRSKIFPVFFCCALWKISSFFYICMTLSFFFRLRSLNIHVHNSFISFLKLRFTCNLWVNTSKKSPCWRNINRNDDELQYMKPVANMSLLQYLPSIKHDSWKCVTVNRKMTQINWNKLYQSTMHRPG